MPRTVKTLIDMEVTGDILLHDPLIDNDSHVITKKYFLDNIRDKIKDALTNGTDITTIIKDIIKDKLMTESELRKVIVEIVKEAIETNTHLKEVIYTVIKDGLLTESDIRKIIMDIIKASLKDPATPDLKNQIIEIVKAYIDASGLDANKVKQIIKEFMDENLITDNEIRAIVRSMLDDYFGSGGGGGTTFPTKVIQIIKDAIINNTDDLGSTVLETIKQYIEANMLTEDDVYALIVKYLKQQLIDENELIEIIKKYFKTNSIPLKWIDLR